MISRKDFLKQLSTAGTAMMLPTGWSSFNDSNSHGQRHIPSYLSGYADEFKKDPHAAALSWFKDAGFGLFLHYGLYSLLGRGEWVQYKDKIPVAKYEKLKSKFTAKNFDPDFITDLALSAGMKYVNITAKHHDGFCLFRTSQTDYNSLNSPTKRDLVGELKQACDQKGLGLFTYYSVGADWHHPYFLPRKAGYLYRPAYAHRQPAYRYDNILDFRKYLDYAGAQIKELVTQYHPAGVWFDPMMGFYANPALFPMTQIYNKIRSLCSYSLLSFKQGATGTEDFAAPEGEDGSFYKKVLKRFDESNALVAKKAWEMNEYKHNETCNTLQPHWWGYSKAADRKHKNAKQVLELLREAQSKNMNLLLNTGPLPDGSIYRGDVKTLREVGQIVKKRNLLR